MTEEWRPVVGHEGRYEVSSLGGLRSVDRLNVRGHRIRGRVLKPGPHQAGYLCAHLYDPFRPTVMHILVAEAFIGARPSPDHEVRHLDGDRKNNNFTNLAWGSHSENEADKERHGTRPRGEQNATAKLTPADVSAIRARIGEPQKVLAEEFGCTFSNISAIQLRKSWRHV